MPPAEGPREKSIAQRTREYIDAHPSVRDCLVHDIVNFSGLARMVMGELGMKNEEAVLAAAIRYGEELKQGNRIHEMEIGEVLKSSRVEVRTKIVSITAKNEWLVLARLEPIFKRMLPRKTLFQVIQGASAITIVTETKMKDEVAGSIGAENILKVRDDLGEVAVRSDESIAETSGVLSYLSRAVAERGINAVEVISCFTDTLFIVEERDIMAAYEILQRATGRD